MDAQKSNAFSVSSNSTSTSTFIPFKERPQLLSEPLKDKDGNDTQIRLKLPLQQVNDDEEPYVPEVKAEQTVTPRKEDVPRMVMAGAMTLEERQARSRANMERRQAYFDEMRRKKAQGDKYNYAILAVGLFATGFVAFKIFRYIFPAASAVAEVAEAVAENVNSST